jgi:hypothetical protein
MANEENERATSGSRAQAGVGGRTGPGERTTVVLPEERWGTAVWKSAVILALATLAFVVVPDRLFSYLTLHVGPHLRDALVLLEVAVAFVLLTWLFIRFQLQRRRP